MAVTLNPAQRETIERPNLTAEALAAWKGYLDSTHREEIQPQTNRPGGKLSARQLSAAHAKTAAEWCDAMNGGAE